MGLKNLETSTFAFLKGREPSKIMDRLFSAPFAFQCFQRLCIFTYSSLKAFNYLSPNVVAHIQQIPDHRYVVDDICVSTNGVLERAAGHGEINHIHRFIMVHHRVDQTAGKGIATPYAIQDVKGK